MRVHECKYNMLIDFFNVFYESAAVERAMRAFEYVDGLSEIIIQADWSQIIIQAD